MKAFAERSQAKDKDIKLGMVDAERFISLIIRNLLIIQSGGQVFSAKCRG